MVKTLATAGASKEEEQSAALGSGEHDFDDEAPLPWVPLILARKSGACKCMCRNGPKRANGL